MDDATKIGLSVALGVFSFVGIAVAMMAVLNAVHDVLLPLTGEHGAAGGVGASVALLFGVPAYLIGRTVKW